MRKIAFDFETDLITPEHQYPRPVCVSAYIEGEAYLYVEDEMKAKIKEWLESEDLLIAQNATFECLVIYFNFPEFRPQLIKALDDGRIFCTQLYEQLKSNIEPSLNKKGEITIKDIRTNKPPPKYTSDGIPKYACRAKSLAGLVKHYFKHDISATKKGDDVWRLRYMELLYVPVEKGERSLMEINKMRQAEGLPLTTYDHWPKAAIDYAKDDSVWTFKVFAKQKRAVPDIQYAQHMRASVALNYMTHRGIEVDLHRVKQLDKELDEILIPTYEELKEQGFVKQNKKGAYTKNNKGLREYITENFETRIYTETGDISLEAQSLKVYLKEKPDELIEKFLTLGKYEKAKSAFVKRLLQANPEDPVVRTNYNAIVSTGRTSSSTSKLMPCSVNIQQMPGKLEGVTFDIRGCMRARDGYKFVSVDYNNLELLAVAHQLYELYGESRMRDMVNYGDVPTDLHSVFACELKSSNEKIKCTYDDFVPHKKEEGYKEYRKKGKPVTLGCPGGMGYDTIRFQFTKDGIDLPIKTVGVFDAEWKAHAVVRDYKHKYPDLRVKRTGKFEWTTVRDEVALLRNMLYKTYPELEKFLKGGHEQFLNGFYKWKKNDFGDWEKDELYSYYVFGQSQNNCTYTALCNAWLMQGTSSVGAKEAGWRLFKEFHDSEEVHLLAFIHDEYCAEVLENENFMKNVDRISEIMIDSQMKYLTSVDVAVEAEWMTYWSKEVTEGSQQYYKKIADYKLRHID